MFGNSKTSDVNPEIAELEGSARTRGAVPNNPVDAIPMEHIEADVNEFVDNKNLLDYQHEIHMGALAAKIENIPGGISQITALTDAEREAILYEEEHPWKSSPLKLYLLCALCAGCAIVQGMDQTIINGAQVHTSYPQQSLFVSLWR